MKRFRNWLLYALVAATIGWIIYLLVGSNPQKTPLIIALLAVLAATVAALPTFRLLELQEDALRPYALPHLDFGSRDSLLQFRVKNIGQGVAYDIRLTWDQHISDVRDIQITALDSIAILIPDQSASTLIDVSHQAIKKMEGNSYKGTISYKDAKGKGFVESFLISVEGHGKQLIYDSELPRTLRELQNLPDALSRIQAAIESIGSEKQK